MDLPYTIFNLIVNGLYFVSFEELPKEERPRKSIWLDKELMAEHWREVERMREDKMKGNDTSKMTRNALVDQLFVRDRRG